MKANRLFEIIYVLLNHKSVTAAELAERFDVSRRTIYRDVDTLSLAGIPIYTEKGKGGGIRLLDDFVLNKSVLREDEQREILSALQGLSAVKTSETDLVLNKLGNFFGAKPVNWIEVDYSDWSFHSGNVFQQLKTAIFGRFIIEFDYYNSRGEKSHRFAEPIQLWFKSKAWYVKAFCLQRGATRTFKLTRIRNLTVTKEIFPMRGLQKSEVSAPIDELRPNVTLLLKVSSHCAYRVYDEFDASEVTPNPDGSFTVRVTWPEDEWVYATILSYGEHIEVLAPGHIQEIIRDKSEKIMEKY
jgi:predicted DNA-binding transcriptional regulator YafY